MQQPGVRIKESKNIVVISEKSGYGISLVNFTSSSSLKLIPIETRDKSNHVADFCIIGSSEIMCLYTTGSVRSFIYEREEGMLVQSKGLVDYVCCYCGKLQNTSTQCKTHIYLLHRGPALCRFCGVELEDNHAVRIHEKDCLFTCTVRSCSWPGSKLARVYKRHMKVHFK